MLVNSKIECAVFIEEFLPARRYASAVLAMAKCPCTCLSVTSRSSVEKGEQIELFRARKLVSTCPTLFDKGGSLVQ